MKTAIQFGAGNIGRGFIGAVLEQSGYHVTFADVNQTIIDLLNSQHGYTVYITDTECSQMHITDIDAVNSLSDELSERIASADIITTAVGLTILPRIAPAIAKGLTLRCARGITTPLNIIACENGLMATSQLKAQVMQHLDETTAQWCRNNVGFADCSVDRIVPPVAAAEGADVHVEKFYEWNVERSALKGAVPEINGMNLADNLLAYVERKLFTLNTGHAITAYMGYLKGYHTIDEAIADEAILGVVRQAMEQSGLGLVAEFGFDRQTHFKYIDKIIGRFRNPYLKDELTRVCRQPLRKLSAEDRLVKPMLTARKYGVPVDALLTGIGAALHYDYPQDEQSVELQQLIAQKGIRAAAAEVTSVADAEILDRIVEAYTNVESKIA